MTAPVNYVRPTINTSHTPPGKKKGWSHKSTQIKITVFHNAACVSLNWAKIVSGLFSLSIRGQK